LGVKRYDRESVGPALIALPEMPEKSPSKLKVTAILYSDLSFDKIAGKGSFGVVFKGNWKGQQVALKKVNTDHVSPTNIEDFQKESDIMASIPRHPNVVWFIGTTVYPDTFVIVSEFCEKGSLLDFLLLKSNEITNELIKKFVLGIAKGLFHLHLQKLVHRDIAARNILLTNTLEPKVADFGLSRKIEQNKDHHTTATNMGPIKWMAPESLTKRIFSPASDAWSFAVTIYEILMREEPFKQEYTTDIIRKVCFEEGHVPIPVGCNPNLVEVMLECFLLEPKNRPTFDVIIDKLQEM